MIKVQGYISAFPKMIMVLSWITESTHIALWKEELNSTSPQATITGTWHAVGNIPAWSPFVSGCTINLRQCQELEQVGTTTLQHEIWQLEEKMCLEQFYHYAKTADDFTNCQMGIKATSSRYSLASDIWAANAETASTPTSALPIFRFITSMLLPSQRE